MREQSLSGTGISGVSVKVLIADDEHRVCQLIRHLIPWEEFGLDLAGIAYNGIEAYELIRTEKPDIVITDIRMPGYDGLTLLEKSKELDPSISFIIVSGYKDFEYAQKALKYGAEDYILKPVSHDDINRILRKIIDRRNSDQNRIQEALETREELEQNRNILKKELVKKLLNSDFKLDSETRQSLSNGNIVNFQAPCFMVFIIQADCIDQSLLGTEHYSISVKILERVEELVNSHAGVEGIETLSAYTKYSLIYLWECPGPAISRDDWERLQEQASQKIAGFSDWRVTFCMGGVYPGLENLSASYSDAELIRKDRLFQGTGKVLTLRPDLPGFEKFEQPDSAPLADAVNRVLENQDLDQFAYGISTYVIGLTRTITHPDQLFRTYRFLCDAIFEQFRKLNVNGDYIGEAYETAASILDLTHNMKLMNTRLSRLFKDMAKTVISSRKVLDNKPIRIAKDYISRNYAEPIDLNMVAAQAGLNPIYFSTLFKKETGMNFKDFLVDIRLEKARELLVNSNETIQEISHLVGYRDTRYFSRIFARNVGLKPNIYRKIHG